MNHTQAWCWHAPANRTSSPSPGKRSPPRARRGPRRQPDHRLQSGGLETHRTGSSPLAARPCARRRWHGHPGGTGANVPPAPAPRHPGRLSHRPAPRRRLCPPHPGAGSRPDAGARCPERRAAAALPCPGLTAWQALAKLPHLHGEALLITGLAAVSAASRCNLPSRRGPRLCQRQPAPPPVAQTARRAGVADYRDPDWLAQLQAANGGEPFEGIIDLVSSQQAEALLPALAITATW